MREHAGDEYLLQQCLLQIEQQLDWGNSQFWTNRDFHELSDLILEQTNISLSPTTLKRVWGRLQYSSRPSPSTLDALANYLDFEHWRAYKLSAQLRGPEVQEKKPIAQSVKKASSSAYRRRISWLALLIVALCFPLLRWLASPSITGSGQTDSTAINSADYSFSFRSLTEGLPNTVIFDYDASASPTDSVYIQQSWDAKRRKLVNKQAQQHTSIYYKPGFYNAKLLIGDSIVQQRELYIYSDDWICLVEQQPVPVYFPQSNTLQDGRLSISPAALAAQNIKMQPQPPVVIYSKVPHLSEPIYSDNFRFQTRIRHDYQNGSAICQYGRISILIKNDAINIPLSQAGCVADIDLYVPGQFYEGRDYDLSGFGTDLSQWTDIELRVIQNKLEILFNHQLAFETTLSTEAKEIVGLRYQFSGTGSVDHLVFSTPAGSNLEDKVIWAEAF